MRSRPTVFGCVRVSVAAGAVFLGLNAQTAELKAKEPTGLAAAFGNTVKALYPDGKHQRIWLHPDGRWEAVGRRGTASSGRWTHNGDKVCLKQSKPFPAPFSYCTVFPSDGGVGAVWAGKDMTGRAIQLTLVPGIER